MELKHPLVFWGSALLVAAAFAAAAPLLLPYGVLRLEDPADRERAWLLTVFIGGVMAVLFGGSALISGPRALGIREVVEAGGVQRARERLRRARAAAAAENDGARLNFGVWLVAAGAFLIAIYFVLWQALG